MNGKFVYMVRNVHSTKPVDVTYPDGVVRKTITATPDPSGTKVLTRVVQL